MMKTNRIFIYKVAVALMMIIVAACADEKVKPVLPDASAFVAPVIINPATNTSVILTPGKANDEFEKLEWDKTNYGIDLSTNYVVEISATEDFAKVKKLAETSANSASISTENFNNAMLGLGLPGFKESKVYIRVKSTINGYQSDPIYSGVITRVATTYQSSECGTYCTVGIIGSASPGGWDTDTDLRLADAAKIDKSTWTTILYLSVGEVKFRASDAWDVNWGASTFPAGTGTTNGPNIPVATAGYYKVTFNDGTGAYTFTLQTTPVYPTVGIIGSGTPGGWDADTDLTKDANNPHLWTGTVTLTDGEAKFRANNAWDSNWGSTTYPSGVGVGGGPNIPVKGGTYFVMFNDATAEYSIGPADRGITYPKVGLIGPAQAGGWDADTDLIRNPANPYLWSKVMTLTEADSKFRANDAWDVNWGGTTFPGGVATQNGNNIPAKAGTYFITFNSLTGEYYFLK